MNLNQDIILICFIIVNIVADGYKYHDGCANNKRNIYIYIYIYIIFVLLF